MKKAPLILFVGGALVAIGMVLSYTGASFISGQISIKESLLNSTIPAELQKELDPSITNKGAFVIRAEGFEKTSLVANLYDPSGTEIATKQITQVSTEEYFDIEGRGDYKLIVQNSGPETPIVLGLTHMPDKALIAINMLGQSMIISGFVGVGIAAIYALKNRKKSS
ncbi:hypothetical protein [Candidatus Nitrosotenuis cloacae]|uniref:Uncharacterized protein n=1 Tax=Candidatus Nitrosotenuis cloacae TaxID=1603555 RepID=A0A3G1B6F7_9ARCH|nr:hypothetical protein [Candidatus Nitrosotenuis cloacae]AJZ75715.1 hypothetical protein SU86_004310 [Candidatus Nitrosotenuis cloacae]